METIYHKARNYIHLIVALRELEWLTLESNNAMKNIFLSAILIPLTLWFQKSDPLYTNISLSQIWRTTLHPHDKAKLR